MGAVNSPRSANVIHVVSLRGKKARERIIIILTQNHVYKNIMKKNMYIHMYAIFISSRFTRIFHYLYIL